MKESISKPKFRDRIREKEFRRRSRSLKHGDLIDLNGQKGTCVFMIKTLLVFRHVFNSLFNLSVQT